MKHTYIQTQELHPDSCQEIAELSSDDPSYAFYLSVKTRKGSLEVYQAVAYVTREGVVGSRLTLCVGSISFTFHSDSGEFYDILKDRDGIELLLRKTLQAHNWGYSVPTESEERIDDVCYTLWDIISTPPYKGTIKVPKYVRKHAQLA